MTLTDEDLELFERSVRAATEQGAAADVDAALADLGWADALGLDTPAAVRSLFEAQGGVGATSSALSQVLAFGLGLAPDATTSVLLPPIGAGSPPGALDGTRLAVRGLVFGAAPSVVVVAASGDGEVAATVDVAALGATPVSGLDPRLGIADVDGTVDADATAPADWAAALCLGRLALSHELIGASRTMLALAREHALERVQFGQPIAMFQAVRHRLAEALVAVETAAAVAGAAWIDLTPTSAAIAKATAGRSARAVAKHTQQVLAGIGFTTEHDLHLFVRRVLVLDQLLGSHVAITKTQGAEWLAARRLPTPLPL